MGGKVCNVLQVCLIVQKVHASALDSHGHVTDAMLQLEGGNAVDDTTPALSGQIQHGARLHAPAAP